MISWRVKEETTNFDLQLLLFIDILPSFAHVTYWFVAAHNFDCHPRRVSSQNGSSAITWLPATTSTHPSFRPAMVYQPQLNSTMVVSHDQPIDFCSQFQDNPLYVDIKLIMFLKNSTNQLWCWYWKWNRWRWYYTKQCIIDFCWTKKHVCDVLLIGRLDLAGG